MLNQHEYTRLMDQAVEDATKRGKRFPDKIKGYCPHCGEELTGFGKHLPGSEWDDDLCQSIVGPYADTLQIIHDSKDLFKRGPDLAEIDALLRWEPWFKVISALFFIKRDPDHPRRIARLKEYSAKMHEAEND